MSVTVTHSIEFHNSAVQLSHCVFVSFRFYTEDELNTIRELNKGDGHRPVIFYLSRYANVI